jgi:hypothetical protein
LNRRGVRTLVMVVAFVLGASGMSVGIAFNSEECSDLARSLTIIPPGLRCSGPKDDWHVPWGTEGPGALPLVLVGGLAGMTLAWLLLRAASRQPPTPT